MTMVSPAQALRDFGGDPGAESPQLARDPAQALGYLELPYRTGSRAGARRCGRNGHSHRCRRIGRIACCAVKAGHAGTVPMGLAQGSHGGSGGMIVADRSHRRAPLRAVCRGRWARRRPATGRRQCHSGRGALLHRCPRPERCDARRHCSEIDAGLQPRSRAPCASASRRRPSCAAPATTDWRCRCSRRCRLQARAVTGQAPMIPLRRRAMMRWPLARLARFGIFSCAAPAGSATIRREIGHAGRCPCIARRGAGLRPSRYCASGHGARITETPLRKVSDKSQGDNDVQLSGSARTCRIRMPERKVRSCRRYSPPMDRQTRRAAGSASSSCGPRSVFLMAVIWPCTAVTCRGRHGRDAPARPLRRRIAPVNGIFEEDSAHCRRVAKRWTRTVSPSASCMMPRIRPQRALRSASYDRGCRRTAVRWVGGRLLRLADPEQRAGSYSAPDPSPRITLPDAAFIAERLRDILRSGASVISRDARASARHTHPADRGIANRA